MANIAGIPEVIHDFNLYLSGSKLAGITGEVKLPDLEAVTVEVDGAGILGSYESPVPGHYKSLEFEIPFRCFNADYFRMIDPTKPVAITLRGAEQINVKSTGATDYVGMRVVVRGRSKKMELGTAKIGGTMDSKIVLELTYILVEMDGKQAIELDKINGVFRINGVDVLAKVKKLT